MAQTRDGGEGCWTDLLDPDPDAVARAVGVELHDVVLARLEAGDRRAEAPRPRIETFGNYVFGILTVPVLADDEVTFQEVDLVATAERLVTVRRTPAGRAPFEVTELRAAAHRRGDGPGMSLYALVDEIAEAFLDLIDVFDDKIDGLEEAVDSWVAGGVRPEISRLRHHLLHVRRTLAPTRDLARSVLDDRVELDGADLFPRDVEVHFADAYDKFLRATDALDLSRDLLAGVRDYHQAEVANEQNEVVKKLTVIASVLLLPTFIVGMYGQNLKGVPEFGFRYGYAFSWMVIIVTTVVQLVYFRRKRWI